MVDRLPISVNWKKVKVYKWMRGELKDCVLICYCICFLCFLHFAHSSFLALLISALLSFVRDFLYSVILYLP